LFRTKSRSESAEMARARVSQVRLSEILRLSQASVSSRLRGVTPWRIDEVAVVATALGVSFESLTRERESAA